MIKKIEKHAFPLKKLIYFILILVFILVIMFIVKQIGLFPIQPANRQGPRLYQP